MLLFIVLVLPVITAIAVATGIIVHVIKRGQQKIDS
jgi:hypothetical protein